MKIHSIEELKEIQGKKVLLRVDFNVPIKKNGEIQDDSRIDESLPTIQFLHEKGAKIIIISHLGRPNGEFKPELVLTNVAAHLEKISGIKVSKTESVLGNNVKETINQMQDGEIVMLENIRFRPEEEACEENFTKELAALGDIFVQDAFGTAHRKHASTWGLANYLPSYAGKLLEKEIKALSPLINQKPAKPLTMIFGGAKIDTKIGLIENFIKKADYFLIGGGLANTFLAAEGKNVGTSLCEKEKIELAKEIIAKVPKGTLLLPSDVVVAEEINENAKAQIVKVDQVTENMKILDIGPATTAKYSEIIAQSATVIWNGPLGLYELHQFENGSKMIAHAIAESGSNSIVGGGDTADCIKRFGIDEAKFSHISTGGGACIEFLSGKKLPGIEVLAA